MWAARGCENRRVDAEEAVQVIRQIAGAALAHADDADLAAVDDAHGEMGEPGFERKRGQQAGAASAEDDDVANHRRSESVRE